MDGPLLWGMHWLCHNGNFLPAGAPLLTAANRGFRYGDGLFETAKFFNGRLLLSTYHFERLFSGLRTLQIMPQFSAAQLTDIVAELCRRNDCTTLARVRIAAYRDEESIASCIVETAPLDQTKMAWNETGWQMRLYPHARKSCDAFSHLKSANYLPYVMAGRYAAEQGADECLVLNGHNRICDGSKTNLFIVNGTEVQTPALSEGGVAGVMRRAVMGVLKSCGYMVRETEITVADVQNAEHVFVTNAIEGLRWVRQFEGRHYGHGPLKKLYADFLTAVLAIE